MPTENEMIALQEHFKGNPSVGYWHDFGHVQLKHNIHLLNHHEWLETMQPFLLGAHIHDVQWPDRDHRTPFSGEIDFDELLPFLTPEMPHTWELSPTRTTEEIHNALKKWKERFPDRI